RSRRACRSRSPGRHPRWRGTRTWGAPRCRGWRRRRVWRSRYLGRGRAHARRGATRRQGRASGSSRELHGLATVAGTFGGERDAVAALGVAKMGGQGRHLARLPPPQLLDELMHQAVVSAGVPIALPMAERLVAVRIRGGPGHDLPRGIVRKPGSTLGITIPAGPVMDALPRGRQERADLDLAGVEATADLAVRPEHP